MLACLCVLGALMIASLVGVAALLSPSGFGFVGAFLSPSSVAGRQPVYGAPTRARAPDYYGVTNSAQQNDQIGSAVAHARAQAETARLRLKASDRELRQTSRGRSPLAQSASRGNGGASAYAPIDVRHSSNF
jgi:hypothetical protein